MPLRCVALALVCALLATSSPAAVAGQTTAAGPRTFGTFEVQGGAHRSPLDGQRVEGVAGVVTDLRSNGFYLQDPSGDGDPATSDAVFVFTREAPLVAVGDGVLVSGLVQEFRPGDDENNLSLTEIVSPEVTIDSHDNPLLPPVVIGRGGRALPTRLVAEGVAGDVEAAQRLQPDASAIDF